MQSDNRILSLKKCDTKQGSKPEKISQFVPVSSKEHSGYSMWVRDATLAFSNALSFLISPFPPHPVAFPQNHGSKQLAEQLSPIVLAIG